MPRLSNQEIKRQAHLAVVEFEGVYGRIAEVVQRAGYGILGRGPDGERHIEVEGSTSALPTHIGLEHYELTHMRNNRDCYLYIVRNVGREQSVHT